MACYMNTEAKYLLPHIPLTYHLIMLKNNPPNYWHWLLVFSTMLIKPLLLSIKLSDGFIFWAERCYKQIWLIMVPIALCKYPLKCDDGHHNLKLGSHVN